MSPPGVMNHPLLMSVATPLRDNMPCTTTKGLLNEPGQNNCFLNSAVQVSAKKYIKIQPKFSCEIKHLNN